MTLCNVRTNQDANKLNSQNLITNHQRDPEILNETDLLGTCKLFEREDGSTGGFLYISYIPGRPYEENPYAQRDVSNLELDFDMRSHIKNDSQWNRELYLRAALQDLRRQTSLDNFDELSVHVSHSKHFNEKGSFFEILRRFFVIQENRTFNLNMRIGKKYLDFISLHEHFNETYAWNKDENRRANCLENQLQEEEFEITQRSQNLMRDRLSQRV